MQVVTISGSQRKKGFTNRLVSLVLDEMEQLCPDMVTNMVQASSLRLNPCKVDCGQLCKKNHFCCTQDDDVMSVVEKLAGADAVILASPLYIKIPSAFNMLLERLVALCFSAETAATGSSVFDGKVCGLVAMAEYTDPQEILRHMHDVALVLKMEPVHLKTYPYLGVGGIGNLDEQKSMGPLKPFAQAKLLARALIERALVDRSRR